MITDWMDHGCTHVGYGFPLYPMRVPPDGVKPYYWNSKCLEAPKPYFNEEGYYYWRSWVVRKVVPGLIPIPTGFIGLPNGEDMIVPFGNLMHNHNKVMNELFTLLGDVDIKPEAGIKGDTTYAYIPDLKEYLNN